jgi:hypothetical protein
MEKGDIYYDTLPSPQVDNEDVVLLIEDKAKKLIIDGAGLLGDAANSPIASPRPVYADFSSSSISLLKTILGAGTFTYRSATQY